MSGQGMPESHSAKVMDLTHGRLDGTVNPDPTRTDVVEEALARLPFPLGSRVRYVWLLPESPGQGIPYSLQQEEWGLNLDLHWPEVQQPASGRMWQSLGVANPVIELTLKERLILIFACIGGSLGLVEEEELASFCGYVTRDGKRRLGRRLDLVVPEIIDPDFEDLAEALKFLGQPELPPADNARRNDGQ